jgi:type IV pilus assembly protein PilY1
VCSTTGTNIGRLYQASFATGVANCAISFYDAQNTRWARYRQESLVATPPEPMMQVSIGAGIIQRSVARQGAGINDGTPISVDFDGMKSLYQIELDRRGHNCRHVPGRQMECDPL